MRALFDVAPALLPIEPGLATRRPFLSNLGLHLPDATRGVRGTLAHAWFDAASAHAAAHLRYSTHRFERGDLKPIQIALVGLLEDARIELLATAELPGLRPVWLRFHTREVLDGHAFPVLMVRLARCLLDATHDDPHPWGGKARRLFFNATDGGRAPQCLHPAALREIASVLGHDIGQMRLQFNHRDYLVEPAYRDDNSHLWQRSANTPPEWQNAADDLPTRTDTPPHADDAGEVTGTDAERSIPARADAHADLGADADADADADASVCAPLAQLQYPEWDRLVGGYRSNWCTVLESPSLPGDASDLRRCIDQHGGLQKQLDRVVRAGRLREPVRLRAQLHGDQIDIDAAVSAAVDRRTRHTPSAKVHQRVDRRARDVTALVLIDSSASTAEAPPNAIGIGIGIGNGISNGNATTTGTTITITGTVLDLARTAAWLTALALSRANDSCAIHAFASNGRHEVRYQRALDFTQPVDAQAMARLAGVRSQLSTRMGAALRHASSVLAAQPQRKRLLLLITDGEPHDIDMCDRQYLIDDARRAVHEASRFGLTVFGVTLDRAADRYMRTVFGAANYRVLDCVASLPKVLQQVVARLAR